VLQEVRETVAAATALAAEIGLRFKSGDPADDALARLAELLTRLPALPHPLPDDLRATLDELSARVASAVGTGSEWLSDSGTAIAAERVRDRLNRAYGVPPRPE
jgi:hypothetical protein